MALDLTHLRPRLNELILVDECEVWRDVEGGQDDTVDPETGEVVENPGDTSLVQTTPCKIRPEYRAFPGDRGGERYITGTFEIAKPADGIKFRIGDQIMMTVSPHHPEIVGVWFRISENLHSSLGLFIKARMENREAPIDNP